MLKKNLTEKLQPSYIPALYLRAMAAAIDWFCVAVIVCLLSLRFNHSENANGSSTYLTFALSAMTSFIGLLVWLAFIPICEGLTGRTVGKRLMKIRVVRLDFSPISISNALIRHFFDLVEIVLLFGIIALMVAYSNPYFRRMGDMFAMTIVVKEP